MKTEQRIFRQGSTTFFVSSLFFPRHVRQDVFDLYSFVRVADDYVDQIPTDSDGFYRLRRMWEATVTDQDFDTTKLSADDTDERVVKNMVRLARKYNFDSAWVESFLDSMQSDLIGKTYETLDDTLWYIYGSAEVIGLMMARIMGLPPEADEAARMQGRAMQMINFIRDVAEDNELGRLYFPAEDLRQFGLVDLVSIKDKEKFNEFVRFELVRYEEWQQQAQRGYKYIPRRLRIPLQTASDMYNWTAQQIKDIPQIVYDRKVKPSKARVMWRILTNSLRVR